MTTTADMYTLNNPPQLTQDNTNPFPNNSLRSCLPLHYQHEHRSSDIVFANNSNPSSSFIHLIERSAGNGANIENNENHYSHNLTGQTTCCMITNNPCGAQQDPPSNHDTINNDYKPNLSLESVNSISCSQVALANTSSPLIKPTDRLALSSIVNTDDAKPNVNAAISNLAPDLSLDEDAPHEEDDGGTETESAYISLPITTGNTYPASGIDSNPPGSTNSTMFPSWTPAQLPTPQTEDISPMPPPTRPASQRKRKRQSDNSAQSIKTLASSAPHRPKPTPRVKTAEQLATEALIEQQNPHATKNELRSLKLRALHAVRIAERELNMPEAEKQRRLRLREYVRQKRAEERSQKNAASQRVSTAPQSNVVSDPHSTTSSVNPSSATLQTGACNGTESRSQDASPAIQIKNEVEFGNQPNNSQTLSPHQFTAFQATNSPLHSTPIPNTCLSLVNVCQPDSAPPMDRTSSNDRQGQTESKTSKQKAPRKKSVSRTKVSVASLEAEIKKQNPHASPTQLKSLKLRALHADRIAEREQNMSEKEKLRRHKLREYMRRRRDEERAEKGNDSTELNQPIEVNHTPDSHLNYRGSFDSNMNSETALHANENSMCSLGAPLTGHEETDAKERLAAFSMMEMTHVYHNQFQQSHSSLHINPLFHMPMVQSTLGVTSPYDCSLQTTYAMSDTWSHIPGPDHDASADELAQKALHAALQEAIYMKPHHEHQADNGEAHHEHFSTNVEHDESNRMAGMEHGESSIVEEDTMGMMRARELAMIAAAAAEVEHAQQMQSSTLSHLH